MKIRYGMIIKDGMPDPDHFIGDNKLAPIGSSKLRNELRALFRTQFKADVCLTYADYASAITQALTFSNAEQSLNGAPPHDSGLRITINRLSTSLAKPMREGIIRFVWNAQAPRMVEACARAGLEFCVMLSGYTRTGTPCWAGVIVYTRDYPKLILQLAKDGAINLVPSEDQMKRIQAIYDNDNH